MSFTICKYCGKKGVSNRNTIRSYKMRKQEQIRKSGEKLKPKYQCKYCHRKY